MKKISLLFLFISFLFSGGVVSAQVSDSSFSVSCIDQKNPISCSVTNRSAKTIFVKQEWKSSYSIGGTEYLLYDDSKKSYTVTPNQTVTQKITANKNTFYATELKVYDYENGSEKGDPVSKRVEGLVGFPVLPACVKSLSKLESTTDPNQYTADVGGAYGMVTLWITNKRFMVDTTKKMGAWSCGADGKISLILDATATTSSQNQTGLPGGGSAAVSAGQAGGTITAPNGQPGGTSVSSTQNDFALSVKLKNPLKVNTIQEVIKLFMDAVVKIAIPFIVVFFIWSGISFILARGNPTEVTKAKNMFWYTIIGTLLILGAWAITDAIVGTINSIAS